MKRILTALLLVASLSGVVVTAEGRGFGSSTETNNVSVTTNSLHPTLLQTRRRRRRGWYRRRRGVRIHWNRGRRVGRRWDNRWNNRRWNNRRRWNRRGNRRRGNMGGHDM